MEIIAALLGILVMAFATLFGQVGQVRLDVQELKDKLSNSKSEYDELKYEFNELKEILDRIEKRIEPLKVFEKVAKFRLRKLEKGKRDLSKK